MKREKFWSFSTFRENGGDKENWGNPTGQENLGVDRKPECRQPNTISLKLIEDHKFEDPGHGTNLT